MSKQSPQARSGTATPKQAVITEAAQAAARSANATPKQAVITETAQAAARFGAAADAVDAAAAAVLEVNRTDLRILGLVLQAGAMAAGPLATAAGLSPAATSTAIQRLVTAGHLRRDVDPADRRRAVVTVTGPAAGLLERIYRPIERAGRAELARYSAAELTVIVDFLRRGERMQLDQAARIRDVRRPQATR